MGQGGVRKQSHPLWPLTVCDLTSLIWVLLSSLSSFDFTMGTLEMFTQKPIIFGGDQHCEGGMLES